MKKIEPPQEIDGFEMPDWWECRWRRKRCGKMSCKMCADLKEERQRHVREGWDPDSMEATMDTAAKKMEQAMKMIAEQAEEMGIDLDEVDTEGIEMSPEPKEFDLYNEVMDWGSDLTEVMKEARERGEMWTGSEAAADLLWYRSTLGAKVYRQLCNVWERENREEFFGEVDYEYTNYVLQECLRILEEALEEVLDYVDDGGEDINTLAGRLEEIKPDILSL